jgi:tRNA (cmo5U34)-methyltransferase
MSFDSIAPVYDSLSRMVYGKSIVAAQNHFLKYIPEGSHILIVGGGTGWIIDAIFEVNRTCSIVYLEASQKMLQKAQARVDADDLPRVKFLFQSEMPSEGSYDVIITNFFLDLFPPHKLVSILHQLKDRMKHDGRWIVTDFVDGGKLWQRLLLQLMYWFFKRISKIEATTLPPWSLLLAEDGMQKVEEKHFYVGFIETAIYKKVNIYLRARHVVA